MRTHALLLFAGILAASGYGDSGDASSPTGPSTSANGFTISPDSATNGDTVTVATVIPVRVHVTQNGVGAASVPVSWAVTAGNGIVSSASTVTDADGMATVNWTVGDTAGVNSLNASSNGASVAIVATTVGGAASALVKVSPDSQSVVAGGTMLLTAQTIDRFGNPSAKVAVSWSATDGSLSAASTITGSTGDAVANFTTPTTPGTYFVTASVQGSASVTFKVVAI
jgi:hypothetical protein